MGDPEMRDDRLKVGVVGAGPWATLVHAPMIAASEQTELSGVWARRPEAASNLAGAHGTTACASFDELLERSEAIAFAVPPDVQADLAVLAARAGKGLLLEKPIALEFRDAERLVAAIDEAGVASQMLLSWRYSSRVRDFLDAVHTAEPVGGRGWFLTGLFVGDMFATPWRLERGPLLDLGPHVLDLLDAALGPIVDVRAHGDRLSWIGIQAEHASGVVSDISLTASTRLDPARAGAEVYSSDGVIEVDTGNVFDQDVMARAVTEFVEAVRGRSPHRLDAHRGLHLQRLIDQAERQLR